MKLSKAARACISKEIARHCRKKRGRCKKRNPQAIAIGYSICRRKGFKSIPKGAR